MEKTVEEILSEHMSGIKTMEDMKTFDKPIVDELIKSLHDRKDTSSFAQVCLYAVIEHLVMVKMLIANLGEAALLLEENNIPFDSMVSSERQQV